MAYVVWWCGFIVYYYVYLYTYVHCGRCVFSRDIPEELWSGIQKYFYRCVARTAGLQAAFVNPTKVYAYMHMCMYMCRYRQLVMEV